MNRYIFLGAVMDFKYYNAWWERSGNWMLQWVGWPLHLPKVQCCFLVIPHFHFATLLMITAGSVCMCVLAGLVCSSPQFSLDWKSTSGNSDGFCHVVRVSQS